MSKWIHLGADMVEPGFVLMYQEALGKEMHAKCVLTADGEFEHTTQPVSVYLATRKWRVWDLERSNLFIAYDPDARQKNCWWETLKKKVGAKSAKKMHTMYGDLVLFRPCDNLLWNELETRRELINFAVTRFLRGVAYNFSF